LPGLNGGGAAAAVPKLTATQVLLHTGRLWVYFT